MLKMISPKNGSKKETIVICEGASFASIGLVERLPTTPVHLRDDEFERCQACGCYGGVWLMTVTDHAIHRDRCLGPE